MLQLGTRETLREQTIERRTSHELPDVGANDDEIRQALGLEGGERQIDALDGGPDILVMAVDEREALCAVTGEIEDDVAHEMAEGRRADAGGAGKALAAARAWLRFIAVEQRWGDNAANARGDAFANRIGQNDIDRERQMRAMLLGGAERQKHGRLGVHPGLEFGPAQLRHEVALRHRRLPIA